MREFRDTCIFVITVTFMGALVFGSLWGLLFIILSAFYNLPTSP